MSAIIPADWVPSDCRLSLQFDGKDGLWHGSVRLIRDHLGYSVMDESGEAFEEAYNKTKSAYELLANGDGDPYRRQYLGRVLGRKER